MRVATTAVRTDQVQNWSQEPAAVGRARQTVPNPQKQLAPILTERGRTTSSAQVNAEEVYRRVELSDTGPHETPQLDLLPSVKAVIGETIGEMVVVICQTSGGEYRTRFPKFLIPKDLIAFGQSVYLKINFDSNYRTPHFSRRDPDPIVSSAEMDDLNGWVGGL